MLYPLAVLSALLLTLYAVFSDPRVQTLAARMVTDVLSEKWKTTVQVGGLDFSITKGVVLTNILVKDLRDTTLLSAQKIAVQLNTKQIFHHNLHIRRILIEDGEFQLITHRGDSVLNLQFLLDHFASTDTVPKPEDTVKKAPWSLSGASLLIRNFRFHFQDENSPPEPAGMDYANIDVRNIDLRMSNISLDGDTINAAINNLMASERSGFELLSFSGEFRVSSRFLKARNLKILTPHSDLQLDFEFNYDHWSAFNDFLNEVHITGDIQPSLFNLRDVGYFAPDVATMNDPMHLEGRVDGTVANFRAEKFRVSFGEHTTFEGDVAATGLPDIYKTYADLHIRSLTTDLPDILAFRLPADGSSIPVPPLLSTLGIVSIQGRFTGYYDDFNARADLRTAIGDAQANLVLKTTGPAKTLTYNGEVACTSLQLDKLLQTSLVGNTTFRGTLNGQGTSLADVDLTMNLQVDTIHLYGYNYQNLNINGTFSEKIYDGLLSVRDPNLWLDFNGRADFHDSIPAFDFTAFIHKAHLFEMHLLSRDSIEHVIGRIDAAFSGNRLDNLSGRIGLYDVSYTEGDKTATLEKFLLKTGTDDGLKKSFHLESDYLHADIVGIFSFSSLLNSATVFVRNYLAHFNLRDSLAVTENAPPQLMKFSLEFGDTHEVTDIFVPGISIAPNTALEGYFDTKNQIFRVEGATPGMKVFGLDVEDVSLEAETGVKQLNLSVNVGTLYLLHAKPGDSLNIQLDSIHLTSLFRRDSIHWNLGWGGREKHSLIDGFVAFSQDQSVRVKLDRFAVYVRNSLWEITQDNYVILDTNQIRFNDLGFISTGKGFTLNGSVSHKPTDTLSVTFDRFDISELDRLLANPNIDVDGVLSGRLKVANLYRELSMNSDLKLDSLSFNKVYLGNATLGVRYNATDNRFDVNSQILYTGNIGTNIPLSLKGSYYLAKPEPHFDFDLKLSNLNLKMVEPFLSSFMSRLSGLVSGEAKLTGTPDKPELSGELNLRRTEFRINYLNVPYSLSDVVTLTHNKILFQNITLYDSLGNQSVLNGAITHNYFQDLALDLHINVKDFSAFNNTYAQNNLFYGKARATGNVTIQGPIDDISIGVKASTGSHTHVVIPISLTADVSQVDYIVFEEPQKKDTLKTGSSTLKGPAKGLSLDLNLSVRPDAEVEVFFPGQLGNIEGSGTGNLTMTMTPSTPFTLLGDYVISKGSFLLQLKNLVRLPFTISPGSQIIWTGDPANADIDLSAVYRTKVPLSGLTSNAEMAAQRVTVDVILRLNGKLTNPLITFGMNLPDAEESAKTIVYNSIDTTNQAVMQAQMVSVLVINQFQAVGGGTSEINVAGASVSVLTNMFSSKLSSLSKNVNVNLNYRPATTSTGQEFDVGLSTQLLNNRLLIDGTFGMASYKNTTVEQANTIVGDINIQYVLTKNRRWRVRAFNKTNTINILENNAPYTQGVGISYQRDFTKIREIFHKRKKKPEHEATKDVSNP